MSLTSKQKRHLRALAHTLKPVVMIGNAGITDGVISEIDGSLAHHELIKIRLGGMQRDDRTAAIDKICQKTTSELVGSIGHIGIFYRTSKQKLISLPKA
ncbi:MAG: ribosome assembly RNA-binding protein YhbY [Gammaproteobacteria bacterium]|nr:ribosome assembly RNA-binding protein YhbY [Gammaproteobacteria bacterium]MCF6364448.1 ribosome assembly RNA-binding protein YhbY [Gammaproteobacteria bacterium]